MFASYNHFRHNVYRDAMIISLADTFTSLLAGFTIFAVLGNLAHNLGVDVQDVVGKGAALAFVSYPLAISKFELFPQFFAVIFFLMLFTLGVGSATPLAGGIITVIHDQFPTVSKSRITIIVCVLGFLSGLIYITPGGQLMLELVDFFGASFVIYIMACLEIMAIAWVYGVRNICRDIEYMLAENVAKVGLYWKFCWAFFIPVVLFVVLVKALIDIKQGIDFDTYPSEALAFGWSLPVFAVSLVLLCAVHSILTRKSVVLVNKLLESMKPAADWGPRDPIIRQGWLDCQQQGMV